MVRNLTRAEWAPTTHIVPFYSDKYGRNARQETQGLAEMLKLAVTSPKEYHLAKSIVKKIDTMHQQAALESCVNFAFQTYCKDIISETPQQHLKEKLFEVYKGEIFDDPECANDFLEALDIFGLPLTYTRDQIQAVRYINKPLL